MPCSVEGCSGARDAWLSGRANNREAVIRRCLGSPWERAPSALAFHRRTGEQKATRPPQRFAMTQAVERLEVQREPGNPASSTSRAIAWPGSAFSEPRGLAEFGAAAPERVPRAFRAGAVRAPLVRRGSPRRATTATAGRGVAGELAGTGEQCVEHQQAAVGVSPRGFVAQCPGRLRRHGRAHAVAQQVEEGVGTAAGQAVEWVALIGLADSRGCRRYARRGRCAAACGSRWRPAAVRRRRPGVSGWTSRGTAASPSSIQTTG